MKAAYLEQTYNLYEALVPLNQPKRGQAEESIDIGSLVKATPHGRFFLIPSNYNMMLAEQALNPVKGREYRLDLIIEATAHHSRKPVVKRGNIWHTGEYGRRARDHHRTHR
jgi:hypothetical protein